MITLKKFTDLFKFKNFLSDNYLDICFFLKENLDNYDTLKKESFIRFTEFAWFDSKLDISLFSSTSFFLAPIFYKKIDYFEKKLTENLSNKIAFEMEKNYIIELSLNNILIKNSQSKFNINNIETYKVVSCNDSHHYRDIYGNLGTRMIGTHPVFYVIFTTKNFLYLDGYTLRYKETDINIKNKINFSNIKTFEYTLSKSLPELIIEYKDSTKDLIILNITLINYLVSLLNDNL